MWYALFTEPMREGSVKKFLEKSGVPVYLPMVERKRRVRVRGTHRFVLRDEKVAAFPRYLFCKAVPDVFKIVRERAPYFRTGRIVVVGNPDPSEIRDEVVEALMNTRLITTPEIGVGTSVRLGALDGSVGTVVALRGNEYLVRVPILGGDRQIRVSANAISEIA